MKFNQKIFLNEILPTLKKLVSIPSVNGNEHKIADYVAKYLSKVEFKVEKVPVAGCGPTVFAQHKFGPNGLNLLFYGHLDTVKPADGWKYPPFKPTIKHGLLYGLGACDMKGGVAAILTAAKKIKKMGLKGSLTVLLVSDEELYSRGCFGLIRSRKLKNVDAAISAEPTGLGRMEIGKVGRIVYEVWVNGGKFEVNPIIDVSKFILNLKNDLTVLALGGGEEFLSKPNSCRIILDKKLKLGEDGRMVLNQLKNLVFKLGLKSRFKIKIFRRPTPYMKPYMVNKKHRIVKVLEEACFKVKGFKPRKVLGLWAGDENYLVKEANIPTVVLGPEGGNIHAANEYVKLSSVVDTANIYVEAAKLFLS